MPNRVPKSDLPENLAPGNFVPDEDLPSIAKEARRQATIDLQPPPESSARTLLEGGTDVAIRSAIPVALTAAGLRLGGIPGAMGAGAVAEAINQAVGLSQPDASQIPIAALAETLPLASRGIKAGGKKLIEILPGVKAVLKQGVVDEVQQMHRQFLPSIASSQLFSNLSKETRDTLIQFPKTIKLAKELGEEETSQLFEIATVKRIGKRAADRLSSAKPEKIVQSPLLGPRGEKLITIIPGQPDLGVNFTVGQANMRRIGARIRQAESGATLEEAHNLRQIRNSIAEEMEDGSRHFPLLKAANQAFKKEEAAADLQDLIRRNVVSVAGKEDIQDVNVPAILNKIRLITDPSDKRNFDKLFVDGLGGQGEIKKIVDTLEKINDIGPISFATGASQQGGLVAQGIMAGIGGSAVAGGLSALGAPASLAFGVGAPVGGLIGARGPSLIAEYLTRPELRPTLLRILQKTGGNITNPERFMVALGAIANQLPRTLNDASDPVEAVLKDTNTPTREKIEAAILGAQMGGSQPALRRSTRSSELR